MKSKNSQSNAISSELSKQDVLKVIEDYYKRYKLSKEDLLSIAKDKLDVPVEIFANRKLAPLECLVKWLKENKKQRLAQIAKLLNRNQRTIWATYDSAKKKLSAKFIIKQQLTVPVEIFANRKLGVLEALVKELRNSYSYAEIASSLKRNQRTIWSAANKK